MSGRNTLWNSICVEQAQESMYGAPLTAEEEGLKYEHDLSQKVEIGRAELRKILKELEQLERAHGVSPSLCRPTRSQEDTMEPQERSQLVTRLLEEATRMQTLLEQAIAAKEQEAAQIAASGHLTDDEPTPTPVYTLEEQYDAWETIAGALSDIQTELNRIEQAEQQSMKK
jgi:hypothetical protein